ncbi:metal-sulfur cluster assembly factor, partial [Alphaproteobacteria bacterium]|nr:metal-sulfur cluster assembly factor [Alphaproteobacteria bacterium]
MTNKNLNDFLPDKNASYFKEYENSDSTKIITKDQIVTELKKVMDPEIPVNLYDLGLIYTIDISLNNISIQMTLTNPNCPVAGSMPESVGKSLEKLENLCSVKVNLVWYPKWNKDM